MHPQARRFCLFTLFASLISTTGYVYLIAPTWPFSRLHLLTSSSSESSTHGNSAYATFLGPPTSKSAFEESTNASSASDPLRDPYFISVRLLNYQFNHAERTKTKLLNVPFLVLVLPEVLSLQTEVLEAEGATIVRIEPLDVPDAFDRDFITNSRFRDVLSKLRLWQLTDWGKILYLDADSFLVQNLDGIFTDPDLSSSMKTLPSNETDEDDSDVHPPEVYLMAASSDTYGDQTEWERPGHINYLCACFMLIAPSLALFDHYVSVLDSAKALENAAYPEQDLLIYVHRIEGRMPWKRIPIEWSANDGEMNDELEGGVKSLHVKGWAGAEGGNIASEKYRGVRDRLVEEMSDYYGSRLR
ncbi:glycosyltransferase family 8 protein [Pleomassaria siparia CBS 279.74]|uniref:Glycosyltransferase family 8 protein n=1 Tax=Pleomassaria siparia CBS 279.74 TaxID=1314801 RepID=A0A6G1JVU7_9PLEO|nr:glycosyltransferase family 8 protein [Pleomassaria siparia CBS 279.74]